MANTHQLYQKFNENIVITPTKKESLRKSRNALRAVVKKEFENKNRKQPKFYGQGSYMMKTLLKQLGDEDYDLDDGIYLQGYDNTPEDEWPAVTTVHSWIYKAVEDQTDGTPKDKNTCIRVKYKAGYHIDLPIYILNGDDAYLAHKAKGWTLSDPKAFNIWFKNAIKKHGEQFRSVVRYVKAWRDYQNDQGNKIKLPGIAISILCYNDFYACNDRDDRSILQTITNIKNTLDTLFVCYKPVVPENEDLLNSLSDNQKNDILNSLDDLIEALSLAMDSNCEKDASEAIRDVMGNRFPLGEESANEESVDQYNSYNSPALINNDKRSS